MAGTIVVDRIESDASYASTINVAGQITFSNTVNFGAYSGTAPVAGFYLPSANNLAFTTASTERMRIDSSGNVGIGTSSPNPNSKLDVAGISQSSNASYPAFQLYNSGLASNAYFRIAYDAANNLVFNNVNNAYNSSTEFMRINSSGNVGIGTSSPTDRLKVVGGNTQVPRDSLIGSSATGNAITVGTSGGSQIKFVQNGSNDELAFITHVSGASHTEQARITGAGLLQFNSGYGSVATAYGCRAWVNFNGTGTVAIRASGNVTSITDNGVGDYTVNFTNAMPDANYGYACNGSIRDATSNNVMLIGGGDRDVAPTSSALRINTVYNNSGVNTSIDAGEVCISIFR